MTRADISALMSVIASGVREYHEKATREIHTTVAGLKEEVARLQKCTGRDGRDGLPGVPGLPGLDGRDGAPGIDGKDGRDGAPGADGKDGRDGAPGIDGKDGRDGAPGLDGKDGRDGAPGIDGKDGRDGTPGINGEDGRDGAPGVDGKDGEDGARGIDGEDGRDGTPGLDGKDGRDGATGIDGKDGLGFDDMMVNYDGERTISFEFVRGDHVRSFPVTLPTVLDRGVWREGQYVHGDAVTYAGAFWIAQRETSDKPGQGSDNGWRLAVKSGRQGKSAYDIARSNGYRGSEKEWLASLIGPQGPAGRPGRDSTQMGSDGRRW